MTPLQIECPPGGTLDDKVTADSESYAEGELELAAEIAERFGIRHEIVKTRELDNPDYASNPVNRCYFCKTELYTQIERILPELGAEVVVNGANIDDRGDHRPGLVAAGEHAVRSPLMEAGLTKQDVRDLARFWDLPVWDKPAMPCLSSRIAYGVEVTPERVARVDAAEQILREELGLAELRVRHEANDLARIEVAPERVPDLLVPATAAKIAEGFRGLGFQFITVDLEGFRSGSMNSVVPFEDLQVLGD